MGSLPYFAAFTFAANHFFILPIKKRQTCRVYMDEAENESEVRPMTADRDARLTAWVENWGNQLLRTCTLLLGDRALAEDAVQETFLKAWQGMDSFEGRNGCSEKTWLTHIAVNTCRSLRRTAWMRRHDRRVSAEDLILPAASEDRTLLLEVQCLPDKLRQLVVLRYFSGCTLDEIARITGLKRATVYSRLQKALKMLRIEETEGGGSP